jgi:hypothetical protein
VSQLAFDDDDQPPAVVAFRQFHAANPHVYVHLVRLARRARRSGATRVGIGQLFEVLRWRVLLSTTDPDFKLNNNYRAHYARLIMEREADLRGIFELRRSYADEARNE